MGNYDHNTTLFNSLNIIMKTENKFSNRLMAFLIKLSVCIFLFLLSIRSGSAIPESVQTENKWKQVRDIYTSQIGIREKGINTGTAVEQYLRYVNLPKGNPWCAAFVCWVFGQAGVENPRSGWSPDLFRLDRVIWTSGVSRSKYQEPRIKNQESRLGQNAIGEPRSKYQEPRIKNQESRLPPSVPYDYPSSLKTGNANASLWDRQLKANSPRTGDIFALYFPEKKRIAHVGFIDQWDGTWLISVEGNTNVSGSIEGDGVYRKRRLVKSIYKVARYINY
jgi:hypothetical protein